MCQIFTLFYLVTILIPIFRLKTRNYLYSSNSLNNKRNFGTPTPSHYCNVSNKYLTMTVNSLQPTVYCVIIIYYYFFRSQLRRRLCMEEEEEEYQGSCGHWNALPRGQEVDANVKEPGQEGEDAVGQE